MVEILISVGIFVFVMVIALGALLAMAESNRRVETMKSVINTLNFALDSMSRSIRTGVNYHCLSSGTLTLPQSCPGGGDYFSFLSYDGSGGSQQITYCRGNGSSCSSTGTAILRSVGGGAFAPITSKEVLIDTVTFYVVGAAAGDSVQPKVNILLTGVVITAGGGSSAAACGTTAQCSQFNLQTSVTQRIYDQ